jgi:dolichyl-phosphate beta-glucosyltransferase
MEQFLSSNFEMFEIIAVNDGSRDNTVSELEKIQREIPIKIIDNKANEGKGKAVKDGIMKSRFEVVMFLDADLAIPIEETSKFLAELEKGYDLSIASRFVPGLKLVEPVLWHRRIMEKIFRMLRMAIINNYDIEDTQCGFKVFSRRAAMDIFPLMTVRRFAFDSEIIFIASQRGWRIKELPITLQNPIRSSVRIFRDSANMSADLIRIRLNNFLGKYKNGVKVISSAFGRGSVCEEAIEGPEAKAGREEKEL